MRILCAVTILTSVLFLSCSREQSLDNSRQRKENVPSSTKSADPSAVNRHINLSSKDLAKELAEHCTKASNALDRAATLVSSERPDKAQLAVEIDLAKENMSTCMTMVHGVAEDALGAEAEHNSSRK